jgi:hypothetical protein
MKRPIFGYIVLILTFIGTLYLVFETGKGEGICECKGGKYLRGYCVKVFME